jgi:hypothetical protein
MREFLYKLVQRLQEEARPLSRNKHFHAFTGEARRALRIDRHLRDLQEHLSKLRELGERPRVRALPGGGVQMVMSHPALSVVRTATLCAEEVLLLARHPAGAWGLGGAESASRSGEPAARQG